MITRNEALELLQWGVAYDPIWNQHSAYSRGLVDVAVNERNKAITFLPRWGMNPRFFCTQVEAKKADDERNASARPDGKVPGACRPTCCHLRRRKCW